VSAQTPTTPEGPLVGAGQYAPFFEVVRHVISFLKWRFSKLPEGSYRYDADSEGPEQKNSEIFISADTPYRPESTGKRPAITVLRSQVVAAGLGLGDRAFIDWATGAKVRMDMYPTNIMINVLSTEPVEAEGLAHFVMQQISAFRDEICAASNGLILYMGGRPMISPPSPAGSLVDSSEIDWVTVVLSYPCYIHGQSTTMLPLNKPVIKGIDVHGTVARPADVTEPQAAVQLQGTAVLQPLQTASDRAAASGDSADLPQTGQDEAQSTQPLTVEIQTR
jgi:hypothetical protein